jgi:hypothetical protein
VTTKHTIEDDEEETYEDLMAGIGELFVNLTYGNGLAEDTKTLHVHFGSKETEERIIPNTELEVVFEESKPPDNSENTEEIPYTAN